MSVKLYYFDARGAAEPIRFILRYGQIDFEDIRVPITENTIPTIPPEIKSKSRWGQVPFIEVNGKTLSQSLAITRYFAKKANLIPQDPFEAALADEYVDAIRDCQTSFSPLYRIEDPKEKEAKLIELLGAAKTKHLSVFESIVKANDGKHLVGNSLSWADICLGHFLNSAQILFQVDFADEYPNLRNLRDTVLNTPRIREWVETRPKTKF